MSYSATNFATTTAFIDTSSGAKEYESTAPPPTDPTAPRPGAETRPTS
ncbi:MAG: hypothetical protein Q4C85_03865 [Actinomyces sp.]|nr:hypothetical protein [Actinomyces sp.]MDO4242884.1 hypothetical protein [Actinomyces sp.]